MSTQIYAAASVNQTPLDWDRNEQNLLEVIDAAKAEQVQLLVFPELAICGTDCEDALWFPDTLRQAWKILVKVAEQTRDTSVRMTLVVGLPVEYDGQLYNVAAVCTEGKIVGLVPKLRFSRTPLSYDTRWFSEIPPVAGTMIDGIPFQSDFTAQLDGSNDSDRPDDLKIRVLFGDDPLPPTTDNMVYAVPLADVFEFGSYYRRAMSLVEKSRLAPEAVFVAANHLGNESGGSIYDGGNLIVGDGQVFVADDRFSYHPWELTILVAESSDDNAEHSENPQNGSTEDESAFFQGETTDSATTDSAAECGEMEDSHSKSEGKAAFSFELPIDSRIDFSAKCGEFSDAVALGLWDYARKTRSKGFVLSLSGGADSAAIACLAEMGLQRAYETLGDDVFFASLGVIAPKAYRSERLVTRLLHTIYQGSANSSTTTRDAAQRLADGLGAAFSEIRIDEFVKGYKTAIEKVIKRELLWETDDLALQNIQARVRVPGVWMLANVKNALLLSTGNRSEAAVGYATMDGDSCGCISPIAGIDKAFLRKFLVWLRDTGPSCWRAVPELDGVLSMPPTAELRPSAYGQTDEKDLMPYEVLNTIELAAIRDRLPPREVIDVLHEKYPELSDVQIDEWIRRFFMMWARNQWKRERFATGFHVDDHNLSPKSGCRFPVISGGFARELRDMPRLEPR